MYVCVVWKIIMLCYLESNTVQKKIKDFMNEWIYLKEIFILVLFRGETAPPTYYVHMWLFEDLFKTFHVVHYVLVLTLILEFKLLRVKYCRILHGYIDALLYKWHCNDGSAKNWGIMYSNFFDASLALNIKAQKHSKYWPWFSWLNI